MATAAQREPLRASPIALPSGCGDDKRAQINPNYIVPVQLTETESDGTVNLVAELGEMPLGTREIYIQRRMCGDFYCFIHGNAQVCATGDTRKDAFNAAVARARRAA